MSTKYYESQRKILDRMLSRISGLSTIEGSTTYMQYSPMTIELENIKLQLDEVVNRNNIVSAYENGYDEEVVKYAEEEGVDRKRANSATGNQTFFGTPNTIIPVGTKFGDEANGRMYETLLNGKIDITGKCTILSISCDKGYKYNAGIGTLNYLPIAISGVTGTTNEEKFTGGTDIESIDDLFYRHQLKVRRNPNGVNNAQFEEWALEVDGCCSCKVYACKDETLTYKRGHVCLVITDSSGRGVNEDLCKKVKDYIAPDEYGEGKVMMAILHVISATELPINLSFDLTLENGFELDVVKANIEEDLSKYLKELKGNRISYTKLGSKLYDVAGVKEYDNLLINGSTDNITLSDNQIPVLGSVTIS